MKKLHFTSILFMLLFLFTAKTGAQDIVAYYPFNGGAVDESSFDQTTMVNGTRLTADRFDVANSAMYFDGEQSYLLAENGAHLQSPAVAVAFWIRLDFLPGTGEVYPLSNGGWQERWKISIPSHGKPIWTTNHENGISDMDAGDGNELEIGTWTHLVMVHDGAKDLIYMNGELAAEKDVAGDLSATVQPFGMGYDPIGGGNFFQGALDEVTIFDGALSAQDIADMYAAQSTPPVFDPGVVASYPFSGNARDASEYKNDGQVTDAWLITDRFGFGQSAYNFDGVSARIDVENSDQMNSPATTVAFWVRVNNLPGTGEAYIASFGGWQERWKVSLPSHGKPVWTTNHVNGISDMDSGDGNELVPGVWTHVTFVHDGAKDLIYMNGQLAAEKDVAGDMNSTGYPLGLGYSPIDNANFFDGALDEFMMVNYALSAQEISDLYDEQNTANIDPSPLVLAMPFANGAVDTTQFANHGINKGAVPASDQFDYASNAMYFDGMSGVDVPNSVQYNSDYTTVMFWVNPEELPGTGEAYIASFGGWQERWKISLPSHGKPVWTTNHETGISDMDSGDGNELVPGTWTHLAFVHGATQDKIYVDGQLAATKDVGGVMNSTNYPFGIGYNPIDNANFFKGWIDDVAIFNTELTDLEIQAIYGFASIDPDPQVDLVADYPLDANVWDESPFRNHGANFGAVPAKDRFDRNNYAMGFDGATSYLRVENSKQLNSPRASVSFWVNVKELPGTGEAYLLSFGGWQERFKISLPSHGKPVWTTNHENGISDMDSGDGNELVVGEWTHLVFVHDSVQDIIYMNGARVAEKDVVGLLNNTTYPLGIGYNIVDGGSFFNGYMDDVQLYRVALTDQEVMDLYTEQSTPPAMDDVTPPTAPMNLRGTVMNTNVNLFWNASEDDISGISGYNVYLDDEISHTVSDVTTGFTGLEPLTLYNFGVSAVDGAGNESTVSTLNLTTGQDATPDTIPPTAPSNLAISAGPNSVVFSWSPSVDDRALGGYIIYIDGIFFDSLGADETSIFIGGLESETLYTFEIEAYDMAGNHSDITDITESTGPPVITDEEGLVAHYPFNGNAEDATPYENHGAIGGDPAFEDADHPNASGEAIVFDGDRDSVLAANAVQLISDYTTVSFWIRVDGQNIEDPEAYVIDFGNWDQRWKISLPQHLKIVWTTNSMNIQFPEFISDMDAGDGNELVLDFWWYVTMVHDGENDIIYLDGQEVNSKPVEGTLNSTGRPLVFATGATVNGVYFQGALDEVKIYNKALTADEVLKLYETGTTGIPFINEELQRYVEFVYPNPAADILTVRHSFDMGQEVLVRVLDEVGRQVDHLRFDQMAGDQFEVNVSGLHGGMYQLNFVVDGKNLGSVPFIKQ